MTPEQRAELARSGAAKANGLASLVRRVEKVWDDATQDEQRQRPGRCCVSC